MFFFNFLGGVEGSVEHSRIAHNRAIGGGGTAGGDGLGGGVAVGSLGAPFGVAGDVMISRSSIVANRAVGGRGSGGPGGEGQGGGIANLEAAATTVSDSLLSRNRAQGGRGTAGATDREGGLYIASGSIESLVHSYVFANWARRGNGVGRDEGLGQGGGVFNEEGGSVTLDAFSRFWIRWNKATDKGDNFFGDLTIL